MVEMVMRTFYCSWLVGLSGSLSLSPATDLPFSTLPLDVLRLSYQSWSPDIPSHLHTCPHFLSSTLQFTTGPFPHTPVCQLFVLLTSICFLLPVMWLLRLVNYLLGLWIPLPAPRRICVPMWTASRTVSLTYIVIQTLNWSCLSAVFGSYTLLLVLHHILWPFRFCDLNRNFSWIANVKFLNILFINNYWQNGAPIVFFITLVR